MKHLKLGLALFSGLLLALSLMVWVSLSAEPTSAVRPSETQRAKAYQQKRAAALKRERVAQEPEAQSADERTVHLTIHLQRLSQRHYPLSTGTTFGPQHYVPTLDEAPWPDLSASVILQDLADSLREEGPLDKDLNRFLDAAETEGLLDDNWDELIDDPWLGLLTLYANYGNDLIHRDWSKSGQLEHFSRSSAIAAQLIETHPTGPVSEYARLLHIHILNKRGTSQHNPDKAQSVILDVLNNTSDPLVVDAALGELNSIQHADENPGIEGWLQDHAHELEADTMEAIATGRITHFATAQNSHKTQEWMTRYQDALDERCGEDPCTHENTHFAEFEARMNSTWGQMPTTWRGAIIQRVYQCHKNNPFSNITTEQIKWDGSTWIPSDTLAPCLGDLSNAFVPLKPTTVKLLIHAPPPGT